MFIFISIAAGMIGGMKANDIAKTFINGCQSLVYGALIVGMARTISVILEQGRSLDTVVNGLASLLDGFSPVAGAVGMYIASGLLHFLISSGSGEAVVFIPILAPLADLMNITRQVAVEAVMLGEGVVNCINPTSGVLMAVLVWRHPLCEMAQVHGSSRFDLVRNRTGVHLHRSVDGLGPVLSKKAVMPGTRITAFLLNSNRFTGGFPLFFPPCLSKQKQSQCNKSNRGKCEEPARISACDLF